MEEMILSAGQMLNGRIEQERVRQMLFLGPTQHVALHFKVTKDHELFFIYASVVSEKDVILQTRLQLLMGDSCMTETLAGSALLPGGTDLKAIPYKGAKVPGFRRGQGDEYELQMNEESAQQAFDLNPTLPPLRLHNMSQGMDSPHSNGSRRRAQSERSRLQDQDISQFIPRVGYPRPFLPEAPYRIQDPSRRDELNQPLGHGQVPPGCGLGSLKRPLIFPSSAREVIAPASARSRVRTSESEPTRSNENFGRPPPAPDMWGS
jgi:hypothetical protein